MRNIQIINIRYGSGVPVPCDPIHDNGIFYHRSRLVQKDAELKELYLNENKLLCANIDFAENKKELSEMMDAGIVNPAPFIVVDELICNGNENYLTCEEIASLGEIECDTTIHFMSLVWASHKNGLSD